MQKHTPEVDLVNFQTTCLVTGDFSMQEQKRCQDRNSCVNVDERLGPSWQQWKCVSMLFLSDEYGRAELTWSQGHTISTNPILRIQLPGYIPLPSVGKELRFHTQ